MSAAACSRCGAPVRSPDSRFCVACGAPIERTGLPLGSHPPLAAHPLPEPLGRRRTLAAWTVGVLAGGGGDTYCLCALDAIEAEFTFREYLELERDYVRTGEFPPEMFEAVARSC